MSDTPYQTFPATFQSKGVVARYADDTLPPGTYLNMDNVEELTENAMVSRLGTIIINRNGTTVVPLGSGALVHTLAKLASFAPNVWRYAGASGILYRIAGNAQGAYTAFATGLSGQHFSWGVYRPTLSSYPYIFIADALRMLKDNGSFTSPQQWGIFQPQTPVVAEALQPQVIILDQFNGTTGSYSFVGYTAPLIGNRSNGALQSAVGANSQPQTVNILNTINLFQNDLAIINAGHGNQESVFIINLTETTITAVFTKNHAVGETVTTSQMTGIVAASTSGTATRTGPFPLTTFPNGVAIAQEDYLAIFLMVDQPSNIQEMRILLDVGDGSFTENYFYKVIAPSVYQPSVSDIVTPAQAVGQSVFASTVNIYGTGQINVFPMQTGDSVWTPVLVQFSDFLPVGNADFFSTTGYSFANVGAFQIQIVTNINGQAEVNMSNLFCFGGAGPDSFAGVSYDWLYTYYNAVTGLESNPCMSMSNVNPPTQTTFITPRRQPVQLTIVPSTDPQVTNIRIYRRGGTLASNYFRVDEIAANSTTYVDIIPDFQIEAADTVSLVNDVPVTSTLPIPVNATLTAAITTPGLQLVLSEPIGASPHVSVNQQVTIGAVSDTAQEVVIVQSVDSFGHFQAYVQNPHSIGVPVAAEAIYGQPCNITAIGYNAAWLAGDPNNPHFLYYSTNFSPECFGSPNFIEVGTPNDPIMAIIPFQGSLYVGTQQHWYVVAPGTQTGGVPTVYPTTAVHGVMSIAGWVTTESEIWHVAIDGIRTFSGGGSVYRTQEIEFLFQNNGSTPIPEVDITQLSSTTMTYWNNIVFFSYTGTDGFRHRINYHTIYKRWRNDDVPAYSQFTEGDTNALLFGDAAGLVHQDRVGVFDEGDTAGKLTTVQIPLNLQTAFLDQGAPKNQKNYNELTIDANTGGQTVNATLLFDDGETVLPIGPFLTTERQKVNLNINNGDGQQAYRVSLQLTGSVIQRVIFYQADIRGVQLAETRQSFDTYWLQFGTSESKIVKQAYIEYTSAAPLTIDLYYDQNPNPQYSFTLPAAPIRTSTWVRFPAIKFRLFRMVTTSAADFQVWQDSKFEVKPICLSKGYSVMSMVP